MTAKHHLDVTSQSLVTNGLSQTLLLGGAGGFVQLYLPKVVTGFFLNMLPIVMAVSVKERGSVFHLCCPLIITV